MEKHIEDFEKCLAMGRTSTAKRRSPELVRVVPTTVSICERGGPQQAGDSPPEKHFSTKPSTKQSPTTKVPPISRLVSMTLLKNVLVWDRPPLRSTGVPNLFGLSPLRCQFADEKAPNKLGIPIGGSWSRYVASLASTMLSTGLLDRRSRPMFNWSEISADLYWLCLNGHQGQQYEPSLVGRKGEGAPTVHPVQPGKGSPEDGGLSY